MWSNMDQQIFTNGWTLTFSNVYDSYEAFAADYQEFEDLQVTPLKNTDFLKHCYLVLMGEFASNNLSNMSVDQFRIRFWTRLNQYAPQYERELEIQKNLIQMTEAEITTSSEAIYNTALNPSQPLSLNTPDGKVREINQQNVTQHKRSKLDAYAYLTDLLNNDLTSRFVDKFRNLFTVVLTGTPLYYTTEV